MAATDYTFTISTDTANGKVVANVLEDEIQAEAGIIVGISVIKTDGDTLTVTMKDALDSIEDGLLTTVVNNHQGTGGNNVFTVRQLPQPSDDEDLWIKGVTFDATLDDDTDFDYTLLHNIDLQGVDCHVYDHSPGDYIEFRVVHPIAGVLAIMGETVYVPPNGQLEPAPAPATKHLVTGLILRWTYHSTATTGNQPKVVCSIRAYK